MYVVALHAQIAGWWSLMRVDHGKATAVGVFENEVTAARVRDLLNRHGLTDPAPVEIDFEAEWAKLCTGASQRTEGIFGWLRSLVRPS